MGRKYLPPKRKQHNQHVWHWVAWKRRHQTHTVTAEERVRYQRELEYDRALADVQRQRHEEARQISSGGRGLGRFNRWK